MSQQETIDIDYLSSLARLELKEDEKKELTQQVKNVISYLKTLDTVDVSGIEPTAHAFPLYNIWDEDIPKNCFSVDEALLNAPEKRHNQIVVPKVIDEA